MARSDPRLQVHPTDRLVGQAPALQALRAQIRHLAAFDTVGSAFVPTLLLQGETGTGKGLVARVIHDSGPRAQGPFIDVNCAAIPETLLEVELFGFEAGTFTDARRAKPGLFESAAHGTLFLDEIDALPLPLQAKLLSTLEEKRVRRLGAVAERQLDVKLIAATPTDLSVRVAGGRFRPDLYHRLAVVVLEIPPVRERGTDIVILAQHFLGQYAAAHGLLPKRLSREAEGWLLQYGWPGNVRELSHLLERVTLLSTAPVVSASTLEQLCLPRLQPAVRPGTPAARDEAEPVDEPARIRHALAQTGGNVVRAAQLLGISRGALRYRLRRYGIGRPLFPLPAPSQEKNTEGGAVSGCPPIPALPHQGGRGIAMHHAGEGGATEAWEQKPVAVLAIDVAWPDSLEPHALHAEPWTPARRWQQTITAKVQGFGGLLVQQVASPLTALFGLPQTLEQLPQRAVQVALALRHALAEARGPDGRPPCPVVRMAIHLGQVRVDTQAPDPTVRLLPLGETLSLPVRLLGQAAPGDILLSSQVGRLVEGWFALQVRAGPAGAETADAVGAYAVVGVGPRRSPLEAYGKRPLSRFVGRERELALLAEILAQVERGRGQVVGLVGEPGVGKSRLCYELTQVARPRGWLILESSPVAYGQETSYLPVIDVLKTYFQLEVHDEVRTIRDTVIRQIQTLDDALTPTLPAVLALLDVAVDDPHWQALDPPQRRQRTLEACKRLWLQVSQIQPLLLVVENLHWIDTETQAVLDSLVDSLPAAHILLLVNYRPDYQHGWGSKTSYTQLRLDPLSPEHAEALLQNLLGDDASLAPFKSHLIHRTEGNPFFLEESVRTLVETQALVGEPGDYRLGKALPALPLPATVQAVLAARIDRLPPEDKRLLQTAAVIGHDVPWRLLQAIAERPEDAIHRGLAHLQTAEFLYETRLFPELEYTFKHALTQQVAYGSLLQERRRALHAQIVEAIEAAAGDRPAEQVERLAHHAFQGETWDKAFAYSRQAGDKAMARSAFREGVACVEQALAAMQHLPEQHDTLAQAIDLRIALEGALLASGESRRGFAYLREAEALATSLDDQQRLGRVVTAMIHGFWRMGDYDHALAYGQRALALTAASGDVFEQARAHGVLGTVYVSLGDYRHAIDVLRRSIASLEGERLHTLHAVMITSVRSRDWLIDCLRELGEFAEGLVCGEEAARIAEVAGHLSSAIYTQYKLGHLFLHQGNLQRAIPVLERALAHCRAADIPLFLSPITATLGLAYALSGRAAEALPLLGQAMEQQSFSAQRGSSTEVVRLGEAYFLAGRLAEAIPLAERALALSRDRKERGTQAWALWILGEIAVHRTPPEVDEAEPHYRQALALAEELGMRPLQAHCHLGLGALYTKASQPEPARAELSAAIGLYRAMDMTFWLPQAEATLAQVGAIG